mmetsp:Transcript_3745/g.12187  ORF Transcript_3745/g.12187 Transcript_3745/m.12187 type:complete len:260 (-) Transcript_3745:103-882(-)
MMYVTRGSCTPPIVVFEGRVVAGAGAGLLAGPRIVKKRRMPVPGARFVARGICSTSIVVFVGRGDPGRERLTATTTRRALLIMPCATRFTPPETERLLVAALFSPCGSVGVKGGGAGVVVEGGGGEGGVVEGAGVVEDGDCRGPLMVLATRRATPASVSAKRRVAEGGGVDKGVEEGVDVVEEGVDVVEEGVEEGLRCTLITASVTSTGGGTVYRYSTSSSESDSSMLAVALASWLVFPRCPTTRRRVNFSKESFEIAT